MCIAEVPRYNAPRSVFAGVETAVGMCEDDVKKTPLKRVSLIWVGVPPSDGIASFPGVEEWQYHVAL